MSEVEVAMVTSVEDEMPVLSTNEVVFSSLATNGFTTMTEGGAEFVLCASALTAQM
jgi:hypothetical protein